MADAILDALLDTAKLIPWLLVMHLLIELFEASAASKIKMNKVLRGPLAPVLGSACGILPQCGFGVVAANLYSRRSIRLGTMVAVFIATSDEAVPILLSSPTKAGLLRLGALLGFKFVAAIVAGYALNALLSRREELSVLPTHVAYHGCHHHTVAGRAGADPHKPHAAHSTASCAPTSADIGTAMTASIGTQSAANCAPCGARSFGVSNPSGRDDKPRQCVAGPTHNEDWCLSRSDLPPKPYGVDSRTANESHCGEHTRVFEYAARAGADLTTQEHDEPAPHDHEHRTHNDEERAHDDENHDHDERAHNDEKGVHGDEKHTLTTRLLVHPLVHTLTVTLYILLVNLFFAVVLYYVGEAKLQRFLESARFYQPLLAALVGLIPNCASSVVLSQMLAAGNLSLGAAFAGLSVNAGLGLAVLIKNNRPATHTLAIIAGLYAYSVLLGELLTLLPQ